MLLDLNPQGKRNLKLMLVSGPMNLTCLVLLPLNLNFDGFVLAFNEVSLCLVLFFGVLKGQISVEKDRPHRILWDLRLSNRIIPMELKSAACSYNFAL